MFVKVKIVNIILTFILEKKKCVDDPKDTAKIFNIFFS